MKLKPLKDEIVDRLKSIALVNRWSRFLADLILQFGDFKSKKIYTVAMRFAHRNDKKCGASPCICPDICQYVSGLFYVQKQMENTIVFRHNLWWQM